ncbi:MPK3 / MAPK3 / mitogen-activated protein kinase 3 [Leishmania donovani]|uniref:Mitogen-activated protein kinase n=3 Tax=Leishmania donovani species complex TaxID=38574 RepID=A4HUG1_LEIIN|nr:putative map kinase 3 [Leishmania infantum JPCM5]XP_003858890.1 mitogen-activated protein kinase 3, putative [Leishmania donovani]CAC9457512.1 mitogen-activated_protein_kinase_3_-_putative [Leishmania infantum]AYU76675.1 mitogen-activated protein kinase 3, putative [Leishmania donovani]TPP46613.1 Protein kinase domain family protein [Leishmania donovani]TPP52633.1 Protein kinase domain family protein [Leishmania donovani]CAJ1986734.1 MPK3 / MAPK3 / mitogen-activated protein kinase 3 [Leish|eukprot:XP_001463702.1 putative map kinase 3 [Leishmania infantum JPCM5]
MHKSNQELSVPKIVGDFKVYNVSGSPFEVPSKYTLLKILGMGAYGIACSCLDGDTGEKVSIKKCRDVFRDVEDGKRVLREIDMMRFFHHENLLNVVNILPPLKREYHSFEDVYVVTPLMDVDMNVVLRSRQVLEESHMQYFVYQILRGLKYLHSANVAHRDLKPANLVTNISCELKIIDFGLSRSVDVPYSELTDYVITRWYRPPELLLENTNYSTAVDIWSVGCIFAEMYNRKPVFPGRNTMDQLRMIAQHIGKPPASIVEHREALEKLNELPDGSLNIPKLVPGLAGNTEGIDFLSKMWTLDPSKRPTAADMLAHPYLAHLHDEEDEPTCPCPFLWAHESTPMGVSELRRAFWADIVDYNPSLEQATPPVTTAGGSSSKNGSGHHH